MNKNVIGVDLGGTKVKLGLVNSSGRILKKVSLPTKAERGPEKVISQIFKGVDTLIGNKKKNVFKWLAWDVFEREECLECDVLPICMGGCPFVGLRMTSK